MFSRYGFDDAHHCRGYSVLEPCWNIPMIGGAGATLMCSYLTYYDSCMAGLVGSIT